MLDQALDAGLGGDGTTRTLPIAKGRDHVSVIVGRGSHIRGATSRSADSDRPGTYPTSTPPDYARWSCLRAKQAPRLASDGSKESLGRMSISITCTNAHYHNTGR